MIGAVACLEISTKTKRGFEELETKLAAIFAAQEAGSEQITRLRHKNALEEALNSLQAAEESFLKQESLEFVITDLKHALEALRELVGEVYSEDLLGAIFSEFCIGK